MIKVLLESGKFIYSEQELKDRLKIKYPKAKLIVETHDKQYEAYDEK